MECVVYRVLLKQAIAAPKPFGTCMPWQLQEGVTHRRSAHRWAVSMYMVQEPLLLW